MTVTTTTHLLRFVVLVLLSLLAPAAIAATPVIGILSEPFTTKENTTEYMIAASYVKWLEMGGARSIAIPYDATADEVDAIFPTIDGMLFPGGGGKILPTAAKQIWHLAQQRNGKEGGFFPIWGTCLGFEYLLMLASYREDILEGGFDAENVSLPLTLWQDHTNSRLYQSRRMQALVEDNNITLNNHHYGITPDHFRRNTQLTSLFDITSINRDRRGNKFVSTIEPKDPDQYPYYGVQYHPEKNAFEYATYPDMPNVPYEAIDHSPEGLHLASHLAQFFVNLTTVAVLRKTEMRTSASPPEPASVGSCSYPPVYTYPRKVGVKFQEFYVIPSNRESSMSNNDELNQRFTGNLGYE